MSTSSVSRAAQTVTRDIGFTEGPVWTSDGRLVVVSVTRGLLYSVSPDAEPVVVAEVGGGPNGLAEAPDGSLWVAQNGGVVIATRSARPCEAGLQRVVGGQVMDVEIGGFEAPNDCTFGPDGRLWFTDPRAPGQPQSAGRVWAYDIATNTREVVISGIGFPNGLAFSPSGEILYVADSAMDCIFAFDVSPAEVGPARAFTSVAAGAPDGLAVDLHGRLYAAVPEADAIAVYFENGELERVISFGERTMPTNLCFGGADMATLFVTAPKGGRVLALDEVFPGRAPTSWAKR